MQTSGVRPGTAYAPKRPWRIVGAALATGVVLLSAGCSGGKPSWSGGSGGAAEPAGSPSPQSSASTVAVTQPPADAKDVVASTEIKYSTDDPGNTTVEVKDSTGKEVEGTLDQAGTTFRPAGALAYGQTYTVTVRDGKGGTASSRFATMAQPSKLVRVSSFLGDGMTVGVAMPLIVTFGRAIPEASRATVERRMIVKATPDQEGTWSWISPTEVHYRPKTYWTAGTTIKYTVKLAGVPMGGGWYGRSDLGVDVKIGRSFVMTVSNRTKKMTVTQDGKVVNTIPVSLGKPSTPSSSGTMVVIEKKLHTVFDTTKELPPGQGYKINIDYAQRITWSGQFIHAAPWSEGVQGKSNVSHGCVNVSEKMGNWLFSRTMMGDPITVSGTGRPLQNGNGWTDWNVSYDTFKKGSAQ